MTPVARLLLARLLLTGLVAAQGGIMLVVEMNRTHATHPHWPGHARFHLVWQNLTTTMFSAVETGLLWWPSGLQTERFYLVAGLIAVPLIGFVAAKVLRGLYGGTMADEGGVPPLRFGGRAWDGNSAAIWAGWVMLIAAVALFRG